MADQEAETVDDGADDAAVPEHGPGNALPPEMSRTTLAAIEQQIATLSPHASADLLAEMGELTAVVLERARAFRKLWEQCAMQWIEANGDLCVGPIRYYVGVKNVTTCHDPMTAMEMLLAACHGDLRQTCECLVARPFKLRNCKTLLTPEQWQKAFRVDDMKDLKEGKPLKGLHRIDTRFSR